MEYSEANELAVVHFCREILIPDRLKSLWFRGRTSYQLLVHIECDVGVDQLEIFVRGMASGKTAWPQVLGLTDRHFDGTVEKHHTPHKIGPEWPLIGKVMIKEQLGYVLAAPAYYSHITLQINSIPHQHPDKFSWKPLPWLRGLRAGTLYLDDHIRQHCALDSLGSSMRLRILQYGCAVAMFWRLRAVVGGGSRVGVPRMGTSAEADNVSHNASVRQVSARANQ